MASIVINMYQTEGKILKDCNEVIAFLMVGMLSCQKESRIKDTGCGNAHALVYEYSIRVG